MIKYAFLCFRESVLRVEQDSLRTDEAEKPYLPSATDHHPSYHFRNNSNNKYGEIRRIGWRMDGTDGAIQGEVGSCGFHGVVVS